MGRFATALLSGTLVSKRTLELLTSQTEPGYGLGFGLFAFRSKEGAGHSGGGPNIGINSDLEFFLDGSYVVAVMGNSDAPAAQNMASEIKRFLAAQ